MESDQLPNPHNDTMLVELPTNAFSVTKTEIEHDDPTADYGVVVKLPNIEDIVYFGVGYNAAFDESMYDEKTAHRVHATMTKMLGHTVWFEKRAHMGVTIERDGKQYVFLKLSKVIGYELTGENK